MKKLLTATATIIMMCQYMHTQEEGQRYEGHLIQKPVMGNIIQQKPPQTASPASSGREGVFATIYRQRQERLTLLEKLIHKRKCQNQSMIGHYRTLSEAVHTMFYHAFKKLYALEHEIQELERDMANDARALSPKPEPAIGFMNSGDVSDLNQLQQRVTTMHDIFNFYTDALKKLIDQYKKLYMTGTLDPKYQREIDDFVSTKLMETQKPMSRLRCP